MKTFKTLGVIAVAVIIGFGFIACETLGLDGLFGIGSASSKSANTEISNPFIGIWVFTASNGWTDEYIFDENTFIYVQNGNYAGKGEYTYTSTDLVRTNTHYMPFSDGVWEARAGDTWTVPYSVSGDTLTLERSAFKKTNVSHAKEIKPPAPQPVLWNPPPQAAPVGNWGNFTFNANGTGTWRSYASDNSYRNEPLTWTASGNKITINRGWGAVVYIYELSGNTLTMVEEQWAMNEFDKITLTRQ